MSARAQVAGIGPGRSRLEQALVLFASVRAGESAVALLLATHAFLLMTSYYVLKTAREPLLLAGGSAELKSYAQAAIACVLLLLVPVLVWISGGVERRRVLHGVTLGAVGILAVFYALGRSGLDIGFAYYVCVGVLGVTLLAQFWSYAAHVLGAERGRRLFPFIMAGAAVGGLLGPALCGALFVALGTWNLLALGGAVLGVTAPLATMAATCAPDRVQAATTCGAPEASDLGAVLRSPYLLLLAVVVVLLNCVATTGDYLLTRALLDEIELEVAAVPDLDRAALVAEFYAQYYFVVNALNVLLQLLVVSRVLRFFGVRTAILVAPMVALVGYGLAAMAPVLAVLNAVKTVENSLNYSVTTTTRQILYLPLSAAEQSAGRTAIETLFFRLGDLLQAGVVAIGVGAFALTLGRLAWLNVGLAVVWAVAALKLGRMGPREDLESLRVSRHALAAGACCALCLVVVAVAPQSVHAQGLFESNEPLALTIDIDERRLCVGCEPTSTRLAYASADGVLRSVTVTLRVRGQWRATGGHCRMPPLFVAFDAASAADTPFAGQKLVPLTTHCIESAAYEQYVLREYLAYRIYNALAATSLRVRLVRVTYRFASERQARAVERYAFFTENFATLAARQGAALTAELPRPEQFDQRELATLELFEYLIGNTDWSIAAGHNIVLLARGDSLTAVPYDFDFSGLVNAGYAQPSPQLRIASVRQRLFRGHCHRGFDWDELSADFVSQRSALEALVEEVPGLTAASRKSVQSYLASFFGASPDTRSARIAAQCRPGTGPDGIQTETRRI